MKSCVLRKLFLNTEMTQIRCMDGGYIVKKPGTNPRPLSYISPQRAFIVFIEERFPIEENAVERP